MDLGPRRDAEWNPTKLVEIPIGRESSKRTGGLFKRDQVVSRIQIQGRKNYRAPEPIKSRLNSREGTDSILIFYLTDGSLLSAESQTRL